MEGHKKFWACWKVGGGSPCCQHETKDAAIKEAARIAAKNATGVFVLEVIGIVEPQDLPVNYKEL